MKKILLLALLIVGCSNQKYIVIKNVLRDDRGVVVFADACKYKKYLNGGFSLIELIVVMAIFMIIIIITRQSLINNIAFLKMFLIKNTHM